MIKKESVNQLIDDFLSGTDYYLVNLNISPDNRISIEIDSFQGVTIEFCVDLNRYIESKLNRDEEDYELEVGSAGLTEPFKVLKQYKKNLGNEVETLTKEGLKIKGELSDVFDDHFILKVEKSIKPEGSKRKTNVIESMTFKYDEIKSTKYIINFK
jgi:ribosome maturation factor RimP